MTRDQIVSLFPEDPDIPAQHQLAPLQQTAYLIGGELRQWGGPMQEVLSPVLRRRGTQLEPRIIGSYPQLTKNEALDALQAAADAYGHGRGTWPTMAVGERIRCIEEFLRRMRLVRERVVQLLMWEVGKSLADARKEFDRTIQYCENSIEAMKDLDRTSSRFVEEEDILAQIRRAPLGIVLCMGPFNYPLNETFTTLIPALIMGNTVIFKPPKLGVLLHQPLLEIYRDVFPPGVINTIYGDGQTVAAPLMESGRIDVLAFIGSSRVADILKKTHPKPHRLRCVLGMEAKNAGIVLPDADLELAVEECLRGSLNFNGQRCTALKILFVHRQMLDRFRERYLAGMATLKRGMPWEEGVVLTPLPEPAKPSYLDGLVKEAVGFGARVINPDGGMHAGSFYEPALVEPVDARMRLYHEEQFGPVVPLVPFDDIEEPIDYLVNATSGQQLSIFSTDPATVGRLIDPLVNQVCRVNINSLCQRNPDTFPFTGRKGSAEGTLSVTDALRVFSIRTLVAAKDVQGNRELLQTITHEHLSNWLTTDFLF